MIEAKETLVGEIASSCSLDGSLNKAIEYVAPTTQEKTITPTKDVQNVLPDDGVFALSKVIVNPIPDEYIQPTGTLDITSNGTYDVTNYENANVNVELDIPYISDMNYLFYNKYRQNDYKNILKLCKNATGMEFLFGATNGAYYSKLTEIDMANFDTSNVTTMESAFRGCSSATKIDMTGWDTSKCQKMSDMFRGASKVETIDISSFTSESITNNSQMFYYCSSLTKLIINNPNLFRMTSTSMLSNTPIANGNGCVFVPDNLIETYKSSTNWSTYASQIKGMSELI